MIPKSFWRRFFLWRVYLIRRILRRLSTFIQFLL